MSIYQTVTHRILDQIRSGVAPWRKSWHSGLPRSLATGREYRGVNILLLATSPFESAYWLTFKQAQRLGGRVRKGEKATSIVFWKWRTEPVDAKNGEKPDKQTRPCVPFIFPVFNLEQVEGIERPAEDRPPVAEHRRVVADQMLQVMARPPTITHSATGQPAYLPSEDRIILPHLSQFQSVDHYYAVLFHELVHATGHASRLDRFRANPLEAWERYSFEELVAEFGAAFLCGFAGIQNQATEDLQAGYIQGWAEALSNDPRMLLRAASAAQRATDYVRGKVEEAPTDAEP